MLTQVTRFASVMDITLEAAQIDVRASFPTAEKYGVGEGGAAMERLDYTLDLRSTAPRERVAALVRRAERACHAASSLRAPVAGTLRLNGEDVSG
jgi:organic hydroperoxide reductase OsmC/OhrA